MNVQRIVGYLLALLIGIALATWSYQQITDPTRGLERQREEGVVLAARELLRNYVAQSGELEIVDPLATNRVAGKVYIYPTDDGWAVSGHYRRAAGAHWRPWLMALDAERRLVSLKVRDDDPGVLARAASEPRFTAESPR